MKKVPKHPMIGTIAKNPRALRTYKRAIILNEKFSKGLV
jgi:hypothetical protein